MRTIICSSFTPQYATHASKLEESLQRLGLTYQFYPYTGTHEHHGWVAWMVNCHRSMDQCLKAMEDHPGTPILFVDADASFERTPDLIEKIEEDAQYHLGLYWTPSGDLANGTMWLRNNDATLQAFQDYVLMARKVLKRWLSSHPSVSRRPSRSVWEQTVLQENLDFLVRKHRLGVFILPDAYCRIFDRKDQDQVDPVIVHWQGSRSIGQSVVRASQPVSPSTEGLFRSLEKPILVVGNAPLSRRDKGIIRAWEGSVLRMNNWHGGGRCDVWVSCCWEDVIIREYHAPVCTVYRPDDSVYSHVVRDWGWDLLEKTGHVLHVADTDWHGRSKDLLATFGTRRPTTGLMVLVALRALEIPFEVVGFTGLAQGHSDERPALVSLGVIMPLVAPTGDGSAVGGVLLP